MPGRRLVLTHIDKDVLFSFFTHPNSSQTNQPYMKLVDRWKSTNELARLVDESGQRTKNRLERLHAFGFLELKGERKGTRWDNYWYINESGIYYVMSTLKRKELKKFLASNEDKRELSFIKDLVVKNKPEIDFLFNQIRSCVKQKEHSKISIIIFYWLKDTFGKNFVRFPFLIPDFNIRTIRSRW